MGILQLRYDTDSDKEIRFVLIVTSLLGLAILGLTMLGIKHR